MQISHFVNIFLIIDSLPVFSGLSFFDKQFIAARSQIVEFKKGQTIYKEGAPPDFFYCMVNGRVEIFHPSEKTHNRQRLSIEFIRRGDYFGSISMLTNNPHTVSARATSDSTALRISRRDFTAIVHKIPKFAVPLSRALSRRLSPKSEKRIFENTVVAILGVQSDLDSSLYTEALAGHLRNESGKSVAVITSVSVKNKKDVAATLVNLAQNNHFVLIDVASGRADIRLEILRESDMWHVISPSDRKSLTKTAALVKQLKSSSGKDTNQAVEILIKDDRFFDKTSYKTKRSLLSGDSFTPLMSDEREFQKTLRQIAREVSGVRIGLAVGGGAAMGLAHIGVFKVLEKEKIPIDIIAATSMGALLSAAWLTGLNASALEDIACNFKNKLRVLFLIDPAVPIRGLIKGRAVRKMLHSYLGNKTFADTRVPLKVVACDITTRKEYIINKGNLVDAVMASIAIPGVFEPATAYDHAQLVDGGIVNPVPVNVLSKLGVKRIIAVNALPAPEDIMPLERKHLTIYDIIVNSFQAMEYTIASYSCQQADVYIHPIPKYADWLEFYNPTKFIKAGKSYAKDALAQIKNLVKK